MNSFFSMLMGFSIFTIINLLSANNIDNYRYMDSLALAAGTDKSSLAHNYTEVYSQYLDKYRNQPIKFLEIGIWTGNSVKLWENYFPLAEMHFIDINPDCIQYHSQRSQYHFNQIDPFFSQNAW